MDIDIGDFDDVLISDFPNAEEEERAGYLEEIVHHSTQFGIGNWNYEGTFDFNDD